jgi:hypothetical protein
VGRADDQSEDDSESESDEDEDPRPAAKAKRTVNGAKKGKSTAAPAPKRVRKKVAPTADEGAAETNGDLFKTDSPFFSKLELP